MQKSKAEWRRNVGEMCSNIRKLTADRKETTVNDTVSDDRQEHTRQSRPLKRHNWLGLFNEGRKGDEQCLENVSVITDAPTGTFESSEGFT